MTTQMHRLQISLPKAQAHFLRERARREGISAAEFIRRLLEREEQAAAAVTQADIDEALSFAGIGEDKLPLIDGKAVTEYPDLYLAEFTRICTSLRRQPGKSCVIGSRLQSLPAGASADEDHADRYERDLRNDRSH